MRLVSLDEIKEIFDFETALADQKQGFISYSKGEVVVPPVVHMMLPEDSVFHVKCAHEIHSSYLVVKTAGLFPSGINGCMLIYSASNGELLYVLNDNGWLTHMRTALAGRIAAELLAPKNIEVIGVLGSGRQAEEQVKALLTFTSCRNLFYWAPTDSWSYQERMETYGFRVTRVDSPDEISDNCNLIITATKSKVPILSRVNPGTHITALGADAPGKQEIDPSVVRRAEIVFCDSRVQCFECGELSYAKEVNVKEIGEGLLTGVNRLDTQVSFCDLTGVGIQDARIAGSIISRLS